MDRLVAKSRAVELVAGGWTLAATGRELGVSTSTVHRWIVASGLTQRVTKPRLTAEAKRLAVELVTAGLSIKQASTRLGIAQYSIHRLLHACRVELTRSVAKPVRCGCGALVTVMPCIACQARKHDETQRNAKANSLLPTAVGSVLRMYPAA